ncbi:mechanosensitive ion channel family protein [Myxacorys almedinensis]|uniref:Mechanosensitive ion channel n=1 Tax=Myxacorys almedinensis A TaxID=2690445 RepID=A0A8J7Z116_9CYAN|nr:mechanosensitive ion channel family protein [Myxacorys almedinensis]NDJ18134.1 mechanosensitive ion channel [Myxacorys almedinensis A]
MARKPWQHSLVGYVVGLSLVLFLNQPGVAQEAVLSSPSPSRLPQLELPRQLSNSLTADASVQTGVVRLDGRPLLTIASPVARDGAQSDTTTLLNVRIQGIEATLNRIATHDLNEAELSVTSSIDSSSSLPILSVNTQYLMTVTTLDAQLQGQEPSAYAEELTQIIRAALLRSRQERQPEFLGRQVLVALGILAGMAAASRILAYVQRRLKEQRDRIEAEMPTVSPTQDLPPHQVHWLVQQQMIKRQQRNFKDVQRRLLKLGHVAIWSGGGFALLGLFPYTRWLQPIVLSTPLKVGAIVLLTYVLMRVSDIFIDRLFQVLEKGEFLSSEDSQRFSLRLSTFSRVAKSLAVIILFSISILAILSSIGIEIIPLLAGAGIVGLGISLASQSLIKDIINGFLILLEDQYAVGDVIQVGQVSGLVESLNLRITQLRNAEGRLITIPNSTITVVENLSKDWSRVDLAIILSSSTSLDRALPLIQAVGDNLRRDQVWQEKIIEPPEVLGVDDLSSTGVTIRVWIKTQPLEQWNVGREFRRRLKLTLDAEGIEIGVPQQVLSLHENSKYKNFEPESSQDEN